MDKRISDISEKISQHSLELILSSCKQAYDRGSAICHVAHLVYTLLDDPNIQDMLNRIEVDYSNISKNLEPIIHHIPAEERLQDGKVVFSVGVRKAILRSFLISRNGVNDMVDPEELLLGCAREPELANILKKLNIDLLKSEKLLAITKGRNQQDDKEDIDLGKYLINLTDKANRGELEKIVNRESELAQLTRTLVRSVKNNAILVGEIGVGRGSIIHALAQGISSGEVTSKLRDKLILELNVPGLTLSLTSRSPGEIVKNLMEKIKRLGKTVILIRNFDVVTDESSIEKTLIGNILKSLVFNLDAHFICTTTNTSYRQLIVKEPSLMGLFEVIKVNEPSVDLATKIVKNIAYKFSTHYQISISDEVINQCVILSKRYIQDRFLPSKAIDLLDEASSKVVLEGRNNLELDDIKIVISEKTNIPIEKLTISEQKKLGNLEGILKESVVGQDDAIHKVSEIIRRGRVGLKDPKKPIGSFLFLGPSGVGKTFLAKNLTRVMYDSENAMIRLDMSEFGEAHTVQRLIGSPPGFTGYEEGGQLTNPIWERPYSLILLDEIEKAHPKVFDLFLQVLDEGRLTDGQGRTVDFKNTIIIATSNIASEILLDKVRQFDSLSKSQDWRIFLEEEIYPILKNFFRIEFINRFDEIIVFNPLDVDCLVLIAKNYVQDIVKRLEDKKVKVVVSEERIRDIANNAYNPELGARPLIRLLQTQIENVLARKIVSGEIKEGDTVNV